MSNETEIQTAPIGIRSDKEYLGDGVYAEFDGHQIWLFLHNGYRRTCEIALEPNVFNKLLDYSNRLCR